ncbi:putative FAD-linked oxidoreductase [Psilocybe cubensis]|uniref:FAD-linked oxidoreductase n=2 Tax=Psilocybe cubensis TaxID=181762 RepID=A0ACB8GJV1_PSICU|nr:putative FAD-linked oxidoreductase [Psilocybe cubensis]KAH9475869.1 putative FAD-linked oxidoreductase [Psilocybe cubensis]
MGTRLWKAAVTAICSLPLVFGTIIADNNRRAVLPDAVCIQISKAISSASGVFHPGDPLYDKGIFHYAISSSQNATCVVEPGTPADVGKILTILGRTRTPFAVKGGGHIANQGFSSTTGVQIAMFRFSEVNYHRASQTIDLGPGLIWDDVYAALQPFGVTAIGGRVTGVGVAGFTLGGGYSYKTNQFGLAVDNVISYQLVKPDGKVVEVTQASDPELFFGLKGGHNNFGIVTRFTVRAFPQTQVWGGSIVSDASTVDALTAATLAFQTNTDPKAAAIIGFSWDPTSSQLTALAFLFYDAPTPPPGIFDGFLDIQPLSSDVGTRDYLNLIQSAPLNATQGTRFAYNALPMLNFTPGISQLLVNETVFWGKALANKSEISVAYLAELFLPNIYSHNTDKTAYPPVRTIPFKPFMLDYNWASEEFDKDWHDAAVASSAHIRNAAVAQGQTDVLRSPVYPNYALAGTPLKEMYGDNLPALRVLKARVDPDNVMGLTGGWKF